MLKPATGGFCHGGGNRWRVSNLLDQSGDAECGSRSQDRAYVARIGGLIEGEDGGSLLILGGGAVLAFLAFAGNASSRGEREAAEYLAAYEPALVSFGLSAWLAVCAAGVGYLSVHWEIQKEHCAKGSDVEGEERFNLLSCRSRRFAIWVWIAGLGAFAVGLLFAWCGIKSFAA